MLRIAMAEDDPAESCRLKEYLNRYSQETGTEISVDEFTDGVQLLFHYTTEYDIVLLDIEMPKMDGMEAAERIRKMDSEVVILFITNMAQYAIQGYKVRAQSYLLKPISYYGLLPELKDQKEIDRQMEEMERSVLIYDSVFKTGDETLDIILTEKKLSCEDKKITMTCMAEGKSLGFINKVDLYTMLGNALDNAIESVAKLADPEKRIIQIAIYQEGLLLMIRIRNYYEGEGREEIETRGV